MKKSRISITDLYQNLTDLNWFQPSHSSCFCPLSGIIDWLKELFDLRYPLLQVLTDILKCHLDTWWYWMELCCGLTRTKPRIRYLSVLMVLRPFWSTISRYNMRRELQTYRSPTTSPTQFHYWFNRKHFWRGKCSVNTMINGSSVNNLCWNNNVFLINWVFL